MGREKSSDEEAETLDLNLVAQTAAVPSALARILDPAEGVGGPLAFGAASLLIVVLAAQRPYLGKRYEIGAARTHLLTLPPGVIEEWP